MGRGFESQATTPVHTKSEYPQTILMPEIRLLISPSKRTTPDDERLKGIKAGELVVVVFGLIERVHLDGLIIYLCICHK